MADPSGELLFVYGELRERALQLDVFGRVPDAEPDLLAGFAIDHVEARHPLADAGRPVLLPRLRATGGERDRVVGAALRLSAEELEAVDELAAPVHRRVRVRLVSAGAAWVYVRSDA